MSRSRRLLIARFAPLFLLAGLSSAAAVADEPGETLLLQDPTVSETSVAFVHAQDLWIAPRGGGEARRLTSDPGLEITPRFSPDGKWIAFTGQYEGNTDVYVISADGGLPKRLTWHPGMDRVQGWQPDGKRILFTSNRVGGPPVDRLYLVSVEGGAPEPLPIPSVGRAAIGPGSGKIAYTPYSDAFRTWKRYRGGRTTPVWIVDPKTLDLEVVPHENASDSFPCWAGGRLWFASDRDGHMNVYSFAPGSKEVKQATRFTDLDVRNLSAGAGVVAFEQAGAIHLLDPATGESKRLKIHLTTDGLARTPRWEPAKGAVRNASISPQGQRAVFEARGEIVSIPRENGDARNLTNTPGVHERDPAWSPDGKKIAYFSDETGEYRLVVRDHLARGAPQSFDLGGAGFYFDPVWSPDSKHVLFDDRANRLAFLTLETGKVTEVEGPQASLGSFGPSGSWSPDSKWIAFEARTSETAYDHVDLFEVATGKVVHVTDAFGSSDQPAFARDGKVLFFRASVDSGPRRFGLDMSASFGRDSSSSLYCVVLKKDGKNPLAPKSDEGDAAPSSRGNRPGPGMDGDGDKAEKADKGEKGEKSEKPDADETDKKDEAGEAPAKPSATLARATGPLVDPEGIDQRILALPIPAGQYGQLACGKDKLFFVERGDDKGGTLKSFDFDEKKAKEVLKGVGGYRVAPGGSHLLVSVGGAWQVTNLAGKDEKKLDVDAVRLKVEPAAEWRQILREVWRIERDYFYDPGMHGVDWPAMWERHAAFLPHVHHRGDLNVLIGEMIGELSCGHEYVSGGQMSQAATGAAVGLLAADVEAKDGRWRIAKIYRGQNWSPDLRSPLTEPGVDARVGDAILSVNGKALSDATDFHAAFEGTVGQQVELSLSSPEDGEKPRTVTVVPIASDGELRRRAWVEDCRKRVDALSGGRLAYAQMPDTAGAGMAAFDRDWYSQLDKEGFVLDERFNHGGKIADYVISVLSRDVLCHWMTRSGWAGRTPFGTMPGPKVMIVNQNAGSGGDALPWMFKKLKLGPIVGVRTWGGLVGISGYPPLMDGGSVTAAAFGIVDTDGSWVVENVGVAPDVEVLETPKDFAAGKDPQLEKAVELAMEALKNAPARTKPKFRPPAPR